jgi:hypothetical protein
MVTLVLKCVKTLVFNLPSTTPCLTHYLNIACCDVYIADPAIGIGIGICLGIGIGIGIGIGDFALCVF